MLKVLSRRPSSAARGGPTQSAGADPAGLSPGHSSSQGTGWCEEVHGGALVLGCLESAVPVASFPPSQGYYATPKETWEKLSSTKINLSSKMHVLQAQIGLLKGISIDRLWIILTCKASCRSRTPRGAVLLGTEGRQKKAQQVERSRAKLRTDIH